MLFQQSMAKMRKQYPGLKSQQGVIIVVALFIVALVATMAYTMMARLERDIRRTNLIMHDTQAEFYAQASVIWAIDQLRNNWEKQKPKQLIDHLPITSPEQEENDYRIVSTIYDMQARYNLNNLTMPNVQADFTRLLRTILPKINKEQAEEMTMAIVDWVSPSARQNEFNKYYAALPSPYRQPHKPMASVSELRLVKGVTPEMFKALEPYVAVLPCPTPMNVQDAPAAIFTALGPTMTLEAGKILVQMREQTPFINTQSFLNLDIVKNHPVPTDKITTISHYFLVETKVSIQSQHLFLYSLLERMTEGNKAIVKIVWQSKGIC